jgi:23S rRNA (guanosine2251-2'-O)-methyltransferase
MIVHGVNPVIEALRAGSVREVHLTRRPDARVAEIERLAATSGVRVVRTTPEALAALTGGAQHQGVAARLETARRRWALRDLVDANGSPLIVILDGVEDPQNVGAIVRTADAAGVTGLVRQERRSAALNAAAAKASAGALAHARIVDVVNIVRAMDELKAQGVWLVGLAGDGSQPYDALDYRPPTAIVVGAEGQGLRRLVREHCDFLARIPMRGHVSSLNVSVAAGVVLYEAVRQRSVAAAR